MNSEQLWQERRLRHHKQMISYLRYILNDHFLIVVFFVIGALLMNYANYIQQQEQLPFVIWFTVVLVLATIVFVGQLATFVQPADAYLLGVQEQDWQPYFQKAMRYSLLFPTLLQLIVTSLVAPLWFKVTPATGIDLIALFLLLCGLKQVDSARRQMQWHHFTRQRHLAMQVVVQWVFNVILLSLFLWESGHVVMESAVIVVVWLVVLVLKQWLKKQRLYRWEEIIKIEQARQQRQQQILSLFVDIPNQKKVAVKRRRYLDGVVDWFSGGEKQSANRYLMARALWRGKTYLSTIILLSLLSIVVTGTITNVLLEAVLQMGCFFMTGFQCLALYYHYYHHPMNRVTANAPIDRIRDLQSILQKLLGLLWGGWMLGSYFWFPLSMERVLSRVAVLLFIELFIYLYSPLRLKKLKK